ncbi:hypothetical protein AMK16_33050 [Streptomyces sp. CB00455]|nr:hypothetical protein AMK16_33050 [Streptomyces sp. CB00455]
MMLAAWPKEWILPSSGSSGVRPVGSVKRVGELSAYAYAEMYGLPAGRPHRRRIGTPAAAAAAGGGGLLILILTLAALGGGGGGTPQTSNPSAPATTVSSPSGLPR